MIPTRLTILKSSGIFAESKIKKIPEMQKIISAFRKVVLAMIREARLCFMLNCKALLKMRFNRFSTQSTQGSDGVISFPDLADHP